MAKSPLAVKRKSTLSAYEPAVPHIGKAHGGPVSLSDKYGC